MAAGRAGLWPAARNPRGRRPEAAAVSGLGWFAETSQETIARPKTGQWLFHPALAPERRAASRQAV